MKTQRKFPGIFQVGIWRKPPEHPLELREKADNEIDIPLINDQKYRNSMWTGDLFSGIQAHLLAATLAFARKPTSEWQTQRRSLESANHER